MNINAFDKAPAYRLYSVNDQDGDTAYREIGYAWANLDGSSFTLQVDAVPLSCQIVMIGISANAQAKELSLRYPSGQIAPAAARMTENDESHVDALRRNMAILYDGAE